MWAMIQNHCPFFYFMKYIILILATWRISSMLTSDSEAGPFNTLDGIRHYGRKLSDAFYCLWCMSIWIGLIITIAYLYQPNYTIWIMLPFALSAGAIAMDKWNG